MSWQGVACPPGSREGDYVLSPRAQGVDCGDCITLSPRVQGVDCGDYN